MLNTSRGLHSGGVGFFTEPLVKAPVHMLNTNRGLHSGGVWFFTEPLVKDPVYLDLDVKHEPWASQRWVRVLY